MRELESGDYDVEGFRGNGSTARCLGLGLTIDRHLNSARQRRLVSSRQPLATIKTSPDDLVNDSTPLSLAVSMLLWSQ